MNYISVYFLSVPTLRLTNLKLKDALHRFREIDFTMMQPSKCDRCISLTHLIDKVHLHSGGKIRGHQVQMYASSYFDPYGTTLT